MGILGTAGRGGGPGTQLARRPGSRTASPARSAGRTPSRARVRMPGWLRWVLLVALLLTGGAAFAAAQRDVTSQASPDVAGPAQGADAGEDGGTGAGAAPGAGAAAEPVAAATGPVVSLTFNESSPAQYRHVRPLLRQHELNATFYVAPGRVDRAEECCMTWQQLEQLYDEGDEIGGSSLDQVDLTQPFSEQEAADLAYKEQQICQGHRLLAARGLDPRSFAYPGGSHRFDFPAAEKSLTDLVAGCGYESGRIVGGLDEQSGQASIALPPEQPFVLPTPGEDGPTPLVLEDLQRHVLATGNGRWVPLVFNAVCHARDAGYDACMASWRPVDDRVLEAFLTWLGNAGEPDGAPAGTSVQTVRQVMGAPPQPPLPARTLVSLTFDDGDRTQAVAAELLRVRGLSGTFYVNSGLVDAGNPYVMSWDQLTQLQAQGHEIGGHTRDHVVLTDEGLREPDVREQVCADRERLQEMGFGAVSFAYPEGALDPAAEEVVRSCGYSSGRSAGGVTTTEHPFAETLPPADPFATLAVDGPEAASAEAGSSEPLTLAGLRRAVLAANENGGGWVQFVLHRVCSQGSLDFVECMRGTGSVDEQTLAGFLDWLQTGAPIGTRVVTVQQAVAGQV